MVKLMEISVLIIMLLHLLVCPYTKVEESFNMQAIHDILNFGFDIEKYDHLEFPGVVPRSFLGPFVVAAVSSPFVLISNMTGASKIIQQYIARATVGLATAVSFLVFCRAIESGFGINVKNWLILVTITQFHFMFYLSRTLPNVLALSFVLLSLSSWLHQKHGLFIWLSGVSIIVFRFDLVMFLGIIVLIELLSGRLKVLYFVLTTFLAGTAVLALTVVVDSFFWRRWLWPEGEVLWFNVVLNKSSDWGTSPFLWYFYSVLPRALSATLVLLPVGMYRARHAMTLLWPALGYILLFSFLPHKELRFIIYTFPVINTVIACGLSALWQSQHKSVWRKLLALASSSLLLGNVLLSLGFLYVAHYNYPGGEAMGVLHRLERDHPAVHVHIDVYTAQTGVTRFTQFRSDWIYNKTEDLLAGSPDMQQYTHLMVGTTTGDTSELRLYADTHTVLATISGFDKFVIARDLFPPVRFEFSDKIYILKKIV